MEDKTKQLMAARDKEWEAKLSASSHEGHESRIKWLEAKIATLLPSPTATPILAPPPVPPQPAKKTISLRPTERTPAAISALLSDARHHEARQQELSSSSSR